MTRFCLVGAGRAGLVHARNVARRIAGASLTCVCDSNLDSAQAVAVELDVAAVESDYRRALARPDVDAAIIVTPTFLHEQIAVFAAEAGKHVFLEKPMALNVAECRQIIAAVDRAGVRLQIGFMRRFDEQFSSAKAMLTEGKLGRVMIIKSTGRGPGGPGRWMYDLAKSNGIVAEVNSHDIDSLLWLTGRRPVRIFAQGANFKSPDARESYPDFYDNVVASITFDDGAMGVIDGTCPAHYGYDARVEILCESGLIQLGSTLRQGLTCVSRDGQGVQQAVSSWRTLFREAYLAEMEHFVDCVRSGQSPSVSGMDGLHAVEVVQAINQSIHTGQVVNLQPDAEVDT
jgi:myo-inositol 2-dehydrogenase/D-chiro-inositol 1-dehydrogenase/scyllo-inositol 2-dehydrogenase (NAD+)